MFDKFSFYLGRNIDKKNVVSSINYTIDSSGNVISKSSESAPLFTSYFATRNAIKIDEGTKQMYIDKNVPIVGSSSTKIWFYDSEYALLSSSFASGFVNVPDDAMYFRISYSNNSIINGYVGYTGDTNYLDFIYCLYNGKVVPYYKKLSKALKQESEQIFFRTSLDGDISFHGDNYEYIKSKSIEDLLIFIIFSNWTSKVFYKGIFGKTDCKIDYDACSCEPEFKELDEYTAVLNKYEDEYDLINCAPAITKIDMYKRSVVQVYVRGSDAITNLLGGTYWESEVNEAVDSKEDLINKYHFSQIITGNEIFISASGGIYSGTYAGTNGYWARSDGMYNITVQNTGYEGSYHILLNDKNGTTLYKTGAALTIDDENNLFINPEYKNNLNFRLVNVNDETDYFEIDTVFVYDIYQRMLCDSSASGTYEIDYNDFASDRQNYKRCIGLTGGTFICTAKVVDEPTKFGMNDDRKYFTNKGLSPFIFTRPLPINRNIWANASLWYVYDAQYDVFEESMRYKYTLRDSYSIASVISAILKKIAPNIEHKATEEYSQFLYSSSNPLPGTSRFYVFLTQKTNILKGEYDQAAQKVNISLKDVFDMLRTCFRCYWYIENNKLKIEHIKYFLNGGSYDAEVIQYDTTMLKDKYNKKLISFFQNSIEFDKSELPARYEFAWADECTELYSGISANIKSNYVEQDKTESISVSKFSSDVDFMLAKPDDFSEDGFALLCPIKNSNGTYELPIIKSQNYIDDTGMSFSASSQNYFASWAYLFGLYLYDLPAVNVDLNIMPGLSAFGLKRCRSHKITMPTTEDFNWLGLIKTGVGNGKIQEISTNIDTDQSEIELLYLPE